MKVCEGHESEQIVVCCARHAGEGHESEQIVVCCALVTQQARERTNCCMLCVGTVWHAADTGHESE